MPPTCRVVIPVRRRRRCCRCWLGCSFSLPLPLSPALRHANSRVINHALHFLPWRRDLRAAAVPCEQDAEGKYHFRYGDPAKNDGEGAQRSFFLPPYWEVRTGARGT